MCLWPLILSMILQSDLLSSRRKCWTKISFSYVQKKTLHTNCLTCWRSSKFLLGSQFKKSNSLRATTVIKRIRPGSKECWAGRNLPSQIKASCKTTQRCFTSCLETINCSLFTTWTYLRRSCQIKLLKKSLMTLGLDILVRGTAQGKQTTKSNDNNLIKLIS